MIRRATQSDAPAIETFLAQYPETSMFLRGNLAAHGVGQGDQDHSTDYFLWETPGIEAVFGLSKGGFLLAQAPHAPDQAFRDFARAIQGQKVVGITGVPDQVGRVMAACNIPQGRPRDEPLYRLNLSDLSDPGIRLHQAAEADLPLLETWYAAYEAETDTGTGASAPDRARKALNGPVRLLIQRGEPVAMASLNAQVADMVQIGGVYVPPEHRGQGLGARVTSARLAEARDAGATQAILFAAGPTAAKSYESIGFQHIGSYRLALFPEPQTVAP